VIESTAEGRTNAIHVLNMGELINIYEVALCLVRAKNLLPDKDVEIRVTGLRKGEKLIEELYTESEQQHLHKTDDDRIFSLRNHDECPVDIQLVIAQLEEKLAKAGGHKTLSGVIKKLFPSLKLV
jgi:FlaA1/EpsC-like NDP-sugar epimerase